MEPADFTRRRRALAHLTSAISGAAPAVYRASLTKGPRRSRLYRIDPTAGGWRCEVWFGSTIHRTDVVETQTHLLERRGQYEREVADLIVDGWIVDE